MRCRSEEMRLFLLGESSPEQSALIESHLSDCESCQAWVDEHAAPVSFWGETAAMLGQSVDVANCNGLVGSPKLSLVAPFDIESLANQRTAEMSGSDTAHAPMTEQVLLGHIQSWCDPVEEGENGIGRLGKYLIESIVGHGGMGVVLRATDTSLGRVVAIKTLLQPTAVHSVSRDRLIREARAVASLKHEHVIDMFSIEQWSDVPYIVMPFIRGGTLGHHAERHSFTFPQILDVARQLSTALDAAHSAGLIHRDIKPSNILLEDGLSHLVLADFGLARTDEDFTVTQSGMAPGTPQWMSPEQATVAAIDHRSDQFSLGSVLYWMTTGRYPFDSDSCYATLMNLVNQDPRPIAQLAPEAPHYLIALIEKMMSKDSSDRFDDMGQVVLLTSRCLEHLRDSSVPVPEELRWVKNVSPERMHRVSILLITAALVLCLVGGMAATTVGHLWFGDEKSSSIQSRSDAEKRLPIDRNKTAPTPLDQQHLTDQSHSKESSLGVPMPEMPEGSPASNPPPPISDPFPIERYGPLDEIELSVAIDHLRNKTHALYWLRRLAYLDADQIPPQVIPLVQEHSQSEKAAVAELVRVILSKNPFIEVEPMHAMSSEPPRAPKHSDENPFVVVENE